MSIPNSPSLSEVSALIFRCVCHYLSHFPFFCCSNVFVFVFVLVLPPFAFSTTTSQKSYDTEIKSENLHKQAIRADWMADSAMANTISKVIRVSSIFHELIKTFTGGLFDSSIFLSVPFFTVSLRDLSLSVPEGRRLHCLRCLLILLSNGLKPSPCCRRPSFVPSSF